jgi:hypothetical protein
MTSKAGWRAAWPHLAAAAIFALATVGLTFPLAPSACCVVDNYGDPLFNVWTLAWDVHALQTQPLHLFDANIFYPYPNALAFSETQVVTAVLSAPFIWVSHNPVWAHNVVLLLAFWLTALAMYGLVWEITRSWSGALIGGFVFAFAHYRIGQLSHLQLLAAFWLPLALLFAHRLVARRRWREALGLGLCLGLQWWTSIYYAFYLALALGVWGLAWLAGEIWSLTKPAPGARRLNTGGLVRTMWQADRRIWLGWGLAVLVAAAIVAPGVAPYLGVRDLIGQRRMEQQQGATLSDYLRAPAQSLWGRLTNPQGVQYEHTLFPGFVALALAAVGLLRHPKRGTVAVYFTLGLIGAILSFGPALRWAAKSPPLVATMPYAVAYQWVPLLGALRVPARMAVLVMLAIAVLAGLACARLKRRWALGLVGLLALEYLAVPVPHMSVPTGSQVPPVYSQWLAQHSPSAPIFEIPTTRVASYTLDTVSLERLALQQYFSVYHWHPLVVGYSGGDPGVLQYLVKYGERPTAPPSLAVLQAWGVRYLVAHRDQMSWDDWAAIAEGAARSPETVLTSTVVGDATVFELAPVEPQPVIWHLQVDDKLEYAYLTALSDSGSLALRERAYTVSAGAASVSGTAPRVIEPGGLVIPVRLPAGTSAAEVTAVVDGQRLTAETGRPALGTRMDLSFENSRLALWYVPTRQLTAGDVFRADVAWLDPPTQTVGTSVRLVNSQGAVVAQRDYGLPRTWTGTWMAYAWLPVPRDVPTGTYSAEVVVYRGSDQKPIGNPVDLGPVEIRQPAPFAMQTVTTAHWSHGVDLLGYDVETPRAAAGSQVAVTLYWRRSAAIPQSYTVFVHLVDDAGQLAAQQDNPPRGGTHPTTDWAKGEVVLDRYALTLPADTPPGVYHLQVGWYQDPAQPLAVQTPQGTASQFGLGPVEVTAP